MTNKELHKIAKEMGLRSKDLARKIGVQPLNVAMWWVGIWDIPNVAEKFIYLLLDHHRLLQRYNSLEQHLTYHARERAVD